MEIIRTPKVINEIWIKTTIITIYLIYQGRKCSDAGQVQQPETFKRNTVHYSNSFNICGSWCKKWNMGKWNIFITIKLFYYPGNYFNFCVLDITHTYCSSRTITVEYYRMPTSNSMQNIPISNISYKKRKR